MNIDPIADNQTELTIATLNSRTDGDPLLNKAVAAILLALTKQSEELSRQSADLVQMKQSLWKPNDLENLIDRRHLSACKECPTRKMVELWEAERQHAVSEKAKSQQGGTTLWSFIFSERGLLIIVVILFALMCARLTLGPQGYSDVTTTMRAGSGVQK